MPTLISLIGLELKNKQSVVSYFYLGRKMAFYANENKGPAADGKSHKQFAFSYTWFEILECDWSEVYWWSYIGRRLIFLSRPATSNKRSFQVACLLILLATDCMEKQFGPSRAGSYSVYRTQNPSKLMISPAAPSLELAARNQTQPPADRGRCGAEHHVACRVLPIQPRLGSMCPIMPATENKQADADHIANNRKPHL